MAVNILLADDHRMVREGLKQLLETDSEINVVAEAGDGYECLNLTNKTCLLYTSPSPRDRG